MYIFGNEISEPVYFRHHYLDMYILGNEKLLDVYFRDKPRFSFTRTWKSEFRRFQLFSIYRELEAAIFTIEFN